MTSGWASPWRTLLPRDKRLSLEQSALVETARVLGQGRSLPVYLEDDELCKVASVVFRDTGHVDLIPKSIRPAVEKAASYYDLPLEWFEDKTTVGVDFTELFLAGSAKVPEFETYFRCLCALHKRRRKYA